MYIKGMYATIITAWILYFFLHSLLAANFVKQWTAQHLPGSMNYYRVVYNIIAIVGLLILLSITFKDKYMLFIPNMLIKAAAVLFVCTGLFILGAAFYIFDKMEFFGFRQQASDTPGPLVFEGIYRYMRHPLYSGVFFLMLGITAYLPTLSNMIVFAITIAYIEIGSRLEERKLIAVFGNEYILYCRRVKRYFPFVY